MPKLTSIATALLLLPFSVWAQAAAGADAGATLVIPAKLVAGEPATLAVLAADGSLLPGVTVAFGGVNVVTDQTGRALFTAPKQTGVVIATLSQGAQATSTVVRIAADHPADELIVDEVPAVVTQGAYFRIAGYGFRGAADANSASIGGHPAVVLAASPLELLVTPSPAVPPGMTEIRIESAGRQAGALHLTVVKLEITADKQRLAPRETSRLTVRALGAWQKLELEARNLTPEIVKLRRGDVQRIKTRGGTENTATLTLEGRRDGEFSVSVRLVPRPAGLPDTDAALRHLMRALPRAPDDLLRERIQRQIHRLEHHAQDAARVRSELERMLQEGAAGEFARAVEAARKALLQR